MSELEIEILGDHWDIDDVVQQGEGARGGSVDRDVRGTRTEPGDRPALGGEQSRNR